MIVGGESTGAVLSLYLASEHPEVKAILCYAPALRLTLSPGMALLLRLLAPFKAYQPKGAMSNAELWQGYPVNPLKGAVQLLDLQRATRPRLAQIQQPLLVMHGRLDTTVAASAPQEVLDGVRSGVKELHWLTHSVHTLLLGAERETAFEITRRFIARTLNGKES